MAYHEAQEAYLLGRRAGDPPNPLDFATGDPLPPQSWEARAWKDTVIANPGEITRLIMTFDQAGLYAWHCHILEHEDNEMMRPYYVGDIPPELMIPPPMPGM
jgi:FtsP/CotA-like multicopper oxidase with cupredoxin domain